METKNQQGAKDAALPIIGQMQKLENGGKPTYLLLSDAGSFPFSEGLFVKVVNGYITDVSTPSLCLWNNEPQGKKDSLLQKENVKAYSLLGKPLKQITSGEHTEIDPNLILIGSQWVIKYGLGEPYRAN